MPRWLTPAEVGELLSVSTRTLAGWRLRRTGPPFVRLSGTVVRYHEGRLAEWMQDRQVERELLTPVQSPFGDTKETRCTES